MFLFPMNFLIFFGIYLTPKLSKYIFYYHLQAKLSNELFLIQTH